MNNDEKKIVKVGTGKIYAIKTYQSNDVYYGSTFEKYLCDRLAKHKNCYKCWKNGKCHYVTSYIMFEKYNDVYIELVSIHENISKDELHKLERISIQNDTNSVNKNIPTRTPKEHYIDNKEVLLEKHKKYYEDNKETLSEYIKNYRNNNKEVLLEKKKNIGMIIKKFFRKNERKK